MAVARHARLCDHIDVRIDAAILRIAVTDLEYRGRPAGFVDEVVAIGVAGSEGGALSGTQHLVTTVGDQRQLPLEHPHQFVLMAVPMTLAGPSAGFDDGQIHPELSQTRMAREPLRRLIEARPVERRWIVALGLNGYCSERDLFGHKRNYSVHNYTVQGQTGARLRDRSRLCRNSGALRAWYSNTPRPYRAPTRDDIGQRVGLTLQSSVGIAHWVNLKCPWKSSSQTSIVKLRLRPLLLDTDSLCSTKYMEVEFHAGTLFSVVEFISATTSGWQLVNSRSHNQ